MAGTIMRLFCFAALCFALAGCSYRMKGKVIEGPYSGVMVVDANDPRLAEPGIAGASIEAEIDPGRHSQKHLGVFNSQLDGTVDIPVSAPGAGTLSYDIELICRYPGYTPVRKALPLPKGNRRILIYLAPGSGSIKRDRDLIRESIEAGRRQGAFDDLPNR